MTSTLDPVGTAREVSRDVSTETLYVLLPDDDDRHFIGEAIAVALAGTLVAAFVRGLTASLEDRTEEWGRRLGTWVADRVEGVLQSPEPEATGVRNLEEAIADADGAAAGWRKTDGAGAASHLHAVLVERGMSETEARSTVDAVTARVREP